VVVPGQKVVGAGARAAGRADKGRGFDGPGTPDHVYAVLATREMVGEPVCEPLGS
jgi:hypothetical protein